MGGMNMRKIALLIVFVLCTSMLFAQGATDDGVYKGVTNNALSPIALEPKDGISYVSLDELLQRSDVISLHCPLTDETRHMIDSQAISKMKKGVVIINTSRGGLIDAEALVDGIKSRHIGAACLDVYEEETDIFFNDRSGHIMDDDILARLISMPNVIVTSHQAFLTEEALNNIAETTIGNVLSFFENDGICDNELCYRCGNIEQCRKERKQRCF